VRESFGLDDASAWLRELHGPGAGGSGWRVPFGALWQEVGLDACRGGYAGPAGGRSPRLLQATSSALATGLGARAASDVRRLALLHAAAATLEASAVAWGQFGAVMGDQRVRLLRRLEHELERFEIDARCAERAIDVDARLADIAVSSALAAFEDVVAGVGARGDALSRLEDAAIDVAVLAVGGAINTERFGTPRPSSLVSDSQLCALGRTAARVAADAEARRSGTEPSHAAGGCSTRFSPAIGSPAVPRSGWSSATRCCALRRARRCAPAGSAWQARRCSS
jgi:hypothetical protein